MCQRLASRNFHRYRFCFIAVMEGYSISLNRNQFIIFLRRYRLVCYSESSIAFIGYLCIYQIVMIIICNTRFAAFYFANRINMAARLCICNTAEYHLAVCIIASVATTLPSSTSSKLNSPSFSSLPSSVLFTFT